MASRHWDDGRSPARWPQWAGGLLGVILVAEIGLLVFQLLRPLPTIELPPPAPSPPAVVGEWSPLSLPSQTLAAHASKPIFAAPVRPRSEKRTTAAPSGQSTKLAARLSLLGIVAGDPAQVIIEDSQTHRTYFVTEGQTVVDGAVVIEIKEMGVVLDLFGEPIELTL